MIGLFAVGVSLLVMLIEVVSKIRSSLSQAIRTCFLRVFLVRLY